MHLEDRRFVQPILALPVEIALATLSAFVGHRAGYRHWTRWGGLPLTLPSAGDAIKIICCRSKSGETNLWPQY